MQNSQHSQIFKLNNLFNNETEPFRKVHRMIDLFESIIKSHTVIIMAEYFSRKEVSDDIKGLLSVGLRTPSLGTWQLFSRELLKELEVAEHTFLLDDFHKEFKQLDKDLNSEKTNVIAFRNGYAHGATPTNEQCTKDIDKFQPFLTNLLNSKWIQQSDFAIENDTVFIKNIANNKTLSTHPILVYRQDEEVGMQLAFFNDLKKKNSVGLLNYALSKHYKDNELYIEFNESLPLKEWGKTGNSEFNQRIEELTEVFKGRLHELEIVKEFVNRQDKGYLSIQGSPGIGKSALIAQVYKKLTHSDYKKSLMVVEYFIRRGTAQAEPKFLLEYLIKRTDAIFSDGKNIRAKSTSAYDMQQAWYDKLRMYGEKDHNKKLVFLIDGLDEAVENELLKYLPRENFKNILFIYGSRPGGHKDIVTFWGQLPVENHKIIELEGLSKQDIRAILYDFVNKYELQDQWLDELTSRSEGNPLYLKLLCNALDNGSIKMNDSKALPKEIDEYYKSILQRYAQMPDGDYLINSLYLFAATIDFLTPTHLELMLDMGEATQIRVMGVLEEVLYENPLTEDVLDYQLFHESFREYLKKNKPSKVKQSEEKVINFCAKWDDYNQLFEQRYALRHYAYHLFSVNTNTSSKVLLELTKNTHYQTTQKKVLQKFTATYNLLQTAIDLASNNKMHKEVIALGLATVELHDEELNDANVIVQMVANNEMNIALDRIADLGGPTREEQERQFTLYILCLMELLLLNSKDKPHKKEAIDILLTHLDGNVTTSLSILNWETFLPPNLMFLLAVECYRIQQDYSVLFKRVENSWDYEWLREKESFSLIELELLEELALRRDGPIDLLIIIAKGYRKEGYVDKANELINECVKLYEEFKSISDICNKSIDFSNNQHTLHNPYYHFELLYEIATELSRSGNSIQFNKFLWEIEKVINQFNSVDIQSIGVLSIAKLLYKSDQIDKANHYFESSIALAEDINELVQQSFVLYEISLSLIRLGLIEKSYEILKDYLLTDIHMLEQNVSIYVEFLSKISIEYCKQGEVDKAVEIASRDGRHKYSLLIEIAFELFSQGLKSKGERIIKNLFGNDEGIGVYIIKDYIRGNIGFDKIKVHDIIRDINSIIITMDIKVKIIRSIIQDAIKKGFFNESIQLMMGGYINWSVSIDYRYFSTDFVVEYNYDFYHELIMKLFVKKIKYQEQKTSTHLVSSFKNIISTQYKNGKGQHPLDIMENIHSTRAYSLLLFEQAILSYSNNKKAKGDIAKAIDLAQNMEIDMEDIGEDMALTIMSVRLSEINMLIQFKDEFLSYDDIRFKCMIMGKLSTEYSKNGALNDAKLIFAEAFELTNKLDFEGEKQEVYNYLVRELSKQGLYEEATQFIDKYIEYNKEDALSFVVKYLFRAGLIDKAEKTINDILEINMFETSFYKDAAIELCNNDNFDEALKMATKLPIWENDVDTEIVDDQYSTTLVAICNRLVSQGKYRMAYTIISDIANVNSRTKGWTCLGKRFYLNNSIEKAQQQLSELPNKEAILYFKRGMAYAINEGNATTETIAKLLPLIKDDIVSVEHILEKHALYSMFIEDVPQEQINEFSNILDIQWAVDIAPKKEVAELQTAENISEWIDTIADEDDRDDALSWAKKVKKGTMTADKFDVKISKLDRV